MYGDKMKNIYIIISFIVVVLIYLFNDEKPITKIDWTDPYITIDVSGAVQNPGVYEFRPGLSKLEIVLDSRIKPIMYADIFEIENIDQVINSDTEIIVPYKEGFEPSILLPCIDLMKVQDFVTIGLLSNTKAESVVSYIKEIGGLKSYSQLLNISGIGERTIEKISSKVRLC